jgi:hypothetical protein
MPTSSKNTAARRLLVLLPALAVLALSAVASAFPTPSPVPYRWQLDFYPGEFRMFVDRGTGQAYWYLTYQVVNRTGKSQIWAPQMTLFTDAGEIMLSGQEVPRGVEEAILDLHGNPLLERQIDVIGDLLVGPENAKDGLAVWPAHTVHVNELSLFIRGLSGESAGVMNPMTGRREVLHKTLQRDYLIPGNAIDRGSAPIELRSQRWILR